MSNISFLNLKEFSKHLVPVTSTQFFTRTDEFHPQGLFSEIIFGPAGSLDRRRIFSYINLQSKVIHPTAFKILIQLDRKIEKFVSALSLFSVDKSGVLQEDEKGVNGISAFIKLFPKINFRGESSDREKYIKLLKKSYQEDTLFIDKVPVIPPSYRDTFTDEETKEKTIDPLNDYYIKILKQSFSVRSSGRSGTVYDLMNWSVQLAVNDHNEFIQTRVGKKYGIIRSQLLGKRVDFSGRAVIASGPTLKADEIGVPLRMAVSLFEPFLIHILLYSNIINRDELQKEMKSFTGTELSVESIRRVIKSIKGGDSIPKPLVEIFFSATETAIHNRVVLAKRDPVLHAESVRGFKPVLIMGNVIQVSSLCVGGFNADFDGDTMALFHPLTDEAQIDARKMMRTNTGNTTTISFDLSKEMCVGLFEITKDIKLNKSPVGVTKEILENATDPYIPVTFRGHSTTMGKAIFNYCLPDKYPFIDQQVTKKIANGILYKIHETLGPEIAKDVANKLKNVGFKFSTIMAPSISLDDIRIPDSILKLKNKLEGKSIEEQIEIIDQMKEIMIKYLKDTGVYDLVESGATKGWDQPLQILVSKGIISDPSGNILSAIKGSFSDGLTPKEYFKAASGARKGLIDRVINTSDTGYTSRKLAFLLGPVEADLYLKDCKTERVLRLKLTKDLIGRLTGRFVIKGSKIIEFNKDDYKEGDSINLRSPIYCRSPKICHICYGRLLERHKTPYVGIVAAQQVGERGTQLILRVFHLGGAIKISVRDILQDIVDNDPLVDKSKISKYLNQIGNDLISKGSCKLTINLEDYEIEKSIEIIEEESIVWVKSLISRIEFHDTVFDIILDYAVELKIKDMVKEGKERIILNYQDGDSILQVPLEKQELKEQVLYVNRLLGGGEVFKDTLHLLMKLYKVYGPIAGDMDLVHLEILISQSLRDKNDESIPARLGKHPDDPAMANIKKNVFSSGFVHGLAFENTGLAIKTGLITEQKMEPSIIEKILTGTLVEKEKEDY